MANYEIPIEILEAHHISPKEEYDSENTFYKSFLCATDYICNKIVEGVATWEDYEEEKTARAFAREQLGKLGN